MTADDDESGGSPACFLDAVDPAYAGYVTEAELGQFLVELLVRERAILDLGRSQNMPDAGAIAEFIAWLEGELGRRQIAPCENADRRFAARADSAPPTPGLPAPEAELVTLLERTLPHIASDTLHAALNRALDTHRYRLIRRPND
jgi:hypothetical protein